MKERGARALRYAAVKEGNARSRSPDEIDQHQRGVLEGAGSRAGLGEQGVTSMGTSTRTRFICTSFISALHGRFRHLQGLK